MPDEDLVELKFRLYDGTDIGPFRYSPASTVAMLKERIVAEWPKGDPFICVRFIQLRMANPNDHCPATMGHCVVLQLGEKFIGNRILRFEDLNDWEAEELIPFLGVFMHSWRTARVHRRMEECLVLGAFGSDLHWFTLDKKIAPKAANDVKLINAGKILENGKTVGQCRIPFGELPKSVITMHVVVQPSLAKAKTGSFYLAGTVWGVMPTPLQLSCWMT
ncbi:hypothetical protein TEA_017397 [Camellia sinensis var. sinensis]|uniref:UBL3-like ubiquitin domain-containing protein n=1 Tax=Camellia sinensis var. sinensis TaxID=542762 RepID=A0A4S4E057_CAMSN|nr:hypothetical protein TEA_017397 [Camellia sinensis var. sinensis]